jgi:hypothetical protein
MYQQHVPLNLSHQHNNQTRSNHIDQPTRQFSIICTISPKCASTKSQQLITITKIYQYQDVLLMICQDMYTT